MKLTTVNTDGGFHISFEEEWSQLKGGCNWYTITPFKIEFERDQIFVDEFSLEIYVLGFGVRLSYSFLTEKAKKILKTLDNVHKARKASGAKSRKKAPKKARKS